MSFSLPYYWVLFKINLRLDGLLVGQAVLRVKGRGHVELAAAEGHPRRPIAVTRSVQRVLGVAFAGFNPHAFGGEGFHRTEAHVFLALALLALVLRDKADERTVHALVVLLRRKLNGYEVSFWHIVVVV